MRPPFFAGLSLLLVSTSAFAAKPHWYGSGSGPAAYALSAQEAAKFHPYAGGRALFDVETSRHRYSRARLALPSEQPKTPFLPTRRAWLTCGSQLLEQLRGWLAGEQGPTVEVPDLVDFRDRALMTYRYEVDPRLVEANPEVSATLFHGVGALHLSHAGVSGPLVRILSNPKDRRAKEVAKLLRKESFTPVRIAAETLDLPMAGNFLGHFEFDQETREKWGTPTAVANTLRPHLLQRRERLHAPSSAGFGFSAGAAIAGMPELGDAFDMLVLIGPVIPGIGGGYPQSRAKLFELAGTLFLPNWEAFYWADTVISQMTWGDLAVPFTKPTLILVGEFDTDVPEVTLRWLEEQAAKFEYVHFHRIRGAEHNVLKGRGPSKHPVTGLPLPAYEPTEAFAIIHRFLRRYGPH